MPTTKAIFGTVPGKIIREDVDLDSANGLAVIITKEMFEYSLMNTNAIRSSSVPYHLIDESCVNFVELVAKAIGLQSPETIGYINHPQGYIYQLKKIND